MDVRNEEAHDRAGSQASENQGLGDEHASRILQQSEHAVGVTNCDAGTASAARKARRERRAAALADCTEIGMELSRLADRLAAGTAVDPAELAEDLYTLSGWLLDEVEAAREVRS